ncbi:MAG: hypothetical protein HUK03_02280 [Bacteroidaceae bacterium]|nr:hypothetical protein [Bacteroidaceae bacterium]
MRKRVLWLVAAAFCSFGAQAQDREIFNHLSASVGVGTTGIDVQVAMPISHYAAIRGGVNIMPTFKFDSNVGIDKDNFLQNYSEYLKKYEVYRPEYAGVSAITADKVEVKSKIGYVTGNILFDVYPAKKSSFHITVGLFFGGKEPIEAYTTNNALLPFSAYNNMLYDYKYNPSAISQIPPGQTRSLYSVLQQEEENFLDKNGNPIYAGLALANGDVLKPAADGSARLDSKVWAVRPYVGIGFGRAVPGVHRLNVSFDLGFAFWGNPTVTWKGESEMVLTKGMVKNDNLKTVLDVTDKLIAYPVLSLKLNCRIF